MADSHHHLFADSAKAPHRKDFVPPLACWPVASASTRRWLTAAG
jgi:hypothetical protein